MDLDRLEAMSEAIERAPHRTFADLERARDMLSGELVKNRNALLATARKWEKAKELVREVFGDIDKTMGMQCPVCDWPGGPMQHPASCRLLELAALVKEAENA